MAATIYPITAGAANTVAVPMQQRQYLGVFNQSATATVYVAFDVAAVAAATAGQITLQPATATNISSVQFIGPGTPFSAVNIIASAAATPVTVVAG